MGGPVVVAARPIPAPQPPAAQVYLVKEVTAALAQQMVYIMLAAVVAVRGLLAVQGQLTPRMVGLAVLVCNLALLERLHIMLAAVVAVLMQPEEVMLTQQVVLAAAVLARIMAREAREQLTRVVVVVAVRFM